MNRLYKIVQKNRKLLNFSRRLLNILYNSRKELLYEKRSKFIKKIVDRYMLNTPTGNVILIVIDSLRYRNLSFTGYHRKTTPYLDTFSYKFKLYSAAPHTYSSVPSIISGLYPHNHGAYIKGSIKYMDSLRRFNMIKKNVVTLPELLMINRTYSTIFATTIYPSVIAVKNTAIKYRDLGYADAGKVLEYVLKRLKKIKDRKYFFCYIHIGDLHGPLDLNNPFADYFGTVKRLPNIEKWDYERPEQQKGEAFEEYKYNRILLYDNLLKYVDEVLKEFVRELRDLSDRPLLFIVTSDHGDEFWEHSDLESQYFYDPRGIYGVGHGHNLFNEVIEVPLLINEFNSNRIKSVVSSKDTSLSTVDIVPTILDWLGVNFEKSLFDGFSLLEKKIPKNRPILSESIAYGYEKKSMIQGKYKLLYSSGDKVAWVFDFDKDPYERYPMSDKEILSSMVTKLKKIIARDIYRRQGMK